MKKFLSLIILSLIITTAATFALNRYRVDFFPIFGNAPTNCVPSNEFLDLSCNPSIISELSYYGWPLNFRTAPNPYSWLQYVPEQEKPQYNIATYQKFNLGNLILDYLVILAITIILILIIKYIILIIKKRFYEKR